MGAYVESFFVKWSKTHRVPSPGCCPSLFTPAITQKSTVYSFHSSVSRISESSEYMESHVFTEQE